MAVRIISKKTEKGDYENPYLAIDYLEWVNESIHVNGITDRTKIYDWIKETKGKAYIIDINGNKNYLIPAISDRGNKYVKTVGDETAPDCLLLLPECA